ncbi:GDP-fucose protein O-fucosyltransferase 2 [Strongyloides ratti]|uniref:GDP-fucose protein O-fucosyltransferase 2 n=1 Tax=Strongyloides ratti TaxID=34506 RepID=A0A090LBR1_STRRB|nr:GDP-fucose protein O-fucosyltransferase 2 [Strongyloides ratti]CEF65573.1 GDP-fucose protein O-fucosyltransferase 2 [Strongyloides ratti]
MLVKHLDKRRLQYFTYNENYDALNSLQYIVSSWNCDQFAEWLKGVDDGIIAYLPKIKKANITGKNLDVIDEEYLENIGIYSFGIRRIIMQAINSLLYFCRDIEKDSLQRLMMMCVSKLDMLIGCVQKVQTTPEQIKNFSKDNLRLNVYTFLNNTYSNLVYVVDEVKKIVFWLDRSPFDRLDMYIQIREKILNDCIDLAKVDSLRSRNILKTNSIYTKAKKMREYLIDLIRTRNDPIFVCTSFTERAVIKINEPTELGINIQSSFRGVHVISEIRTDSPADRCEKLDAGDEILQINESNYNDTDHNIGKQIVLLVNKRPRNPIAAKMFIRPNKPKQRPISPVPEDSSMQWLKLNRTSSLNIAKSAWRNHNQRYAGSTIQFASIAHISLEEEDSKKIRRRNSISGDKPDGTEYEDVPFEIEIDNELMRRNSFVSSYLKSRRKRTVFRQFSNDTIILEQDNSVDATSSDIPNIIIRRTKRMRQQPNEHVKSFINNRLTDEDVDFNNINEELIEGENITANLNYAEIELVQNDNILDLNIDKIPCVSDLDWSAPINEITKLHHKQEDKTKNHSLGSLESPKVNSNFYFDSSPSNSATPRSNICPISPLYYNKVPLSPFGINNRGKCFTPASTTFTDISEELSSSRQSTSSTYNVIKTTSPSSSVSSHYSLVSTIHKTKPALNMLAPLAEPDDSGNINTPKRLPNQYLNSNYDKKPSLEDIIEITEIPYVNLSGILIEGNSRWRNSTRYKFTKGWAVLASINGVRYLLIYSSQKSEKASILIQPRYFKISLDIKLKTSKKHLLFLSNKSFEIYLATYTREDTLFWNDYLIKGNLMINEVDNIDEITQKYILQHSYYIRSNSSTVKCYNNNNNIQYSAHLEIPSGNESKNFLSSLIFKSKLLSRKTPRDITISKLDKTKFSLSEKKYIIYDVNYGEGFNLRRDVYLRIANTIRILRENGHNYILVLPPFGRLYHWKKGESQIPWKNLFDIKSLQKFIPVIDFNDFLKEEGGYIKIDLILYLQGYKEGWGSHFEIKYDERDCIENKYYKYANNRWYGWFFGYEDNVIAKNFQCLSIQGQSNTLSNAIIHSYINNRIIFIDRAEVILHDIFSDVYYWRARRSMRYAHYLIKYGDLFRSEMFNSTDINDKTVMDDDWRLVKKQHGDAIGGNYVCVHWRRGDFVRSHSKDIPSIKGTANQVELFAKKYSLNKVFVSSDCNDIEWQKLKNEFNNNLEIFRFEDKDLSDGGISIIDQYICSHARAFIGSYVSTFSFRIHEDREIMGFLPETTFNRLCPDNDLNCEQPTKWLIKYS